MPTGDGRVCTSITSSARVWCVGTSVGWCWTLLGARPGRAKKESAGKPAPARPEAPAPRPPDPGVQQLEQRAKEAEARAQEAERRAQQREQDAQQTGAKVRGLERELREAQAALQAQAA